MSDDNNNIALPTEFVDAHQHYVDTPTNDFQTFLARFVPKATYLPEHYERDVVLPLREAGIRMVGRVHVEALADDGSKEAQWVDSLYRHHEHRRRMAIVASCNLASDDVVDQLRNIRDASPDLVRGIRWILDCVGKYEPNTATHVSTLRHDGIDYLRGGIDGTTMPSFERGFALLEDYQWTFDLQCAPVQLPAAASLFRRYPNIPVCIDHLGKPRMLLGPDDEIIDEGGGAAEPDPSELHSWREGMRMMAELSHVRVKISMVGYAIPGWTRHPSRVLAMRSLIREVVETFGPRRCMIALNWWKDGATSDSDGLSMIGPDPVRYLRYMSEFFSDYSAEDRERLFVGTAREFYRIPRDD